MNSGNVQGGRLSDSINGNEFRKSSRIKCKSKRDLTSTFLCFLLLFASVAESTSISLNHRQVRDLDEGDIPVLDPAPINSSDKRPTVHMRYETRDAPEEADSADSSTTTTTSTTATTIATTTTTATSTATQKNVIERDPQGVGRERPEALTSLVFIAIVSSICVVAFVAFVGGAYCWYKNNDMARLAQKTDYPAYGVTGPNPLHYNKTGPPIDRNLNRNAEVYHYQQQKQKLKALSSASSEGSSRSRPSTTETLGDIAAETNEDDEENSEGEYTVYECPGLASTTDGPLEIHNPLFADSDSFTSYRTSLTNNLTSSKYNYSSTVTNQG